MADTKDIAWKPIGYCVGAFVLGAVLGTFLIGPAVKKFKDKQLADKSTKKILEATKK